MTLQERIEQLLKECFDAIDDPSCSLSKLLRRAIRLAKLREDTENLVWLQWEMLDGIVYNPYHVFAAQLIPEAASRYDASSWRLLLRLQLELRIRDREVHRWELDGTRDSEPMVVYLSVPQIETARDEARTGISEALQPDAPGVAPYYHPIERANAKVDLSIMHRHTADELSAVLMRIRERVHNFLTRTEHEIVSGHTYAAFFETIVRYVDDVLPRVSPQAHQQLQAAWRRLREKSPESNSHAMVSCRRALKSLADALYPPTSVAVACGDGKARVLGDDKYVSRLIQYLHENLGGRSAQKLIESRVTDIGGRIEGAYELSCKGTHATVEMGEAEQCVVQTLLLIADILRIKEGTSAVLLAPDSTTSCLSDGE